MEAPEASNAEDKMPRSSIVLMVIVWIIWLLLFLTWPVDLLVVFLKGLKPTAEFSGDELFYMLGFVGFLSLSITFAIRWFVFGFLIHEKRIKPRTPASCVVGIIGAITVYGLTKSVETYGLVLALRSDLVLEQLIFSGASLIIFIIHLPNWMIPKRLRRPQSAPTE